MMKIRMRKIHARQSICGGGVDLNRSIGFPCILSRGGCSLFTKTLPPMTTTAAGLLASRLVLGRSQIPDAVQADATEASSRPAQRASRKCPVMIDAYKYVQCRETCEALCCDIILSGLLSEEFGSIHFPGRVRQHYRLCSAALGRGKTRGNVLEETRPPFPVADGSGRNLGVASARSVKKTVEREIDPPVRSRRRPVRDVLC